MNKFKVNDVVVVTGNNSIDFWASDLYKELSQLVKINTITEVTLIYKFDCIRDLNNNVKVKLSNGESSVRFLAEDLRRATKREQFLYHLYGPHVLGEESEI